MAEKRQSRKTRLLRKELGRISDKEEGKGFAT